MGTGSFLAPAPAVSSVVMIRLGNAPRRWVAQLIVAGIVLACSATATQAPTPTATTTPTATSSATATTGPFSSLPAGCATEASGEATAPRVTITDLKVQGFADYDVVEFDFDRGLPTYRITQVQPPFVHDPSGLPLEVRGSSFYSIVLQGASIVDEELQPVYEGPTDFDAKLTRIQHVVLAGDFEAVSTWIVGLARQSCLVVQALPGQRLVIGFVDAAG